MVLDAPSPAAASYLPLFFIKVSGVPSLPATVNSAPARALPSLPSVFYMVRPPYIRLFFNVSVSRPPLKLHSVTSLVFVTC